MAESKQRTPTSTADIAEGASNESQKGELRYLIWKYNLSHLVSGHLESPESLEKNANPDGETSRLPILH